jgi:GNAT superfamily N-acetyltransferase
VGDRSEIRVREATAADVAALVEFNLALARESEDVELERTTLEAGVRAALEDPGRARYFVAELAGPGQRGELVGCTMLTTEVSDWRNGEFWWIQSVYVVPAQRGRRVFSLLFRHLERLAQQTPRVVGLRLYVEQENHQARAIYTHLGLEPTRYHLLERDFVLKRAK